MDEPVTRTLPLVSMIMATNRLLPYLEQSLASMAAQSYPKMEIIVVDDGSPDPERLKETVGRYPAQLLRQPASGASVARNQGVARARGEFVGFFDDDDRYPPDWVSKHVEYFQTHPEVVLTYGRIRSIDVNGDFLSEDPLRQADIHDIYPDAVGILTGSMIVRRDAFLQAGGFHPLLRYAEDPELVLRLALRGAFGYVADTYRDYRTHESNATRDYKQMVRYTRAMHSFYLSVLRLGGRNDLARDLQVRIQANDRYVWWRAMRAAGALVRRGALPRAIAEVVWAMRLAPLGPISAAYQRWRHRFR